MLELYEPAEGYQSMVNRLNELKRGGELTSTDLLQLKPIINNSLVGSSKLLHCLNPEKFAIWDRRVCRFVRGTANNYQVEKPSNYLAYLEDCKQLMRTIEFPEVHQRIDAAIGYHVSGMRALEWVMYMNGLDKRPAT